MSYSILFHAAEHGANAVVEAVSMTCVIRTCAFGGRIVAEEMGLSSCREDPPLPVDPGIFADDPDQ